MDFYLSHINYCKLNHFFKTTTKSSGQLEQIDYSTSLKKNRSHRCYRELRWATSTYSVHDPFRWRFVGVYWYKNSHNKFNFLILCALLAWASLFPIYSRHTSLCPAEGGYMKVSFCSVHFFSVLCGVWLSPFLLHYSFACIIQMLAFFPVLLQATSIIMCRISAV